MCFSILQTRVWNVHESKPATQHDVSHFVSLFMFCCVCVFCSSSFSNKPMHVLSVCLWFSIWIKIIIYYLGWIFVVVVCCCNRNLLHLMCLCLCYCLCACVCVCVWWIFWADILLCDATYFEIDLKFFNFKKVIF